ncbi:PLDc N-terminal domain-containing protein [Arthrobacter sp. NPDC055585]
MDQGVNPIMPFWWEFVVTAMGAVILALTVAAVISLARQKHLAPGIKLLCLLGVLGFPALGPALWFVHLYRVRRSRPAHPTEAVRMAASRGANRR